MHVYIYIYSVYVEPALEVPYGTETGIYTYGKLGQWLLIASLLASPGHQHQWHGMKIYTPLCEDSHDPCYNYVATL